jgi:hypothetical protein
MALANAIDALMFKNNAFPLPGVSMTKGEVVIEINGVPFKSFSLPPTAFRSAGSTVIHADSSAIILRKPDI